MVEARQFPDISDILQRKRAGRVAAMDKSFGEKIAIVERLKRDLASIRAARDESKRPKAPGKGGS